VAAYQQFIEQVIAKLNAKCQKKFALELATLQPLPKYRTPDYEIRSAKVTCNSTITVRCVLYTVPSRLIGHRLKLHLYHDRIVGFLGTTPVVDLARVHIHGSEKKRRARSIDYKHVAESLRRKPHAFLYCQWQADLLPNLQWHQLWESLKADFGPDQAARLITEALYIAATQDQESQVADYLQTQLEHSTLTLSGLKQAFKFKLSTEQYPELTSQQHDLSDYDQLLHIRPGQPIPVADDDPQTVAVEAFSRRVAEHRTSSDPGELVLRSVSIGFGPRRSQPSGAEPDLPRALRSAAALRKILDQF
jgi:hypothetical protein